MDAAASVRETGGSRRLRGSVCVVESRRPAARLRERAEAGGRGGARSVAYLTNEVFFYDTGRARRDERTNDARASGGEDDGSVSAPISSHVRPTAAWFGLSINSLVEMLGTPIAPAFVVRPVSARADGHGAGRGNQERFRVPRTSFS